MIEDRGSRIEDPTELNRRKMPAKNCRRTTAIDDIIGKRFASTLPVVGSDYDICFLVGGPGAQSRGPVSLLDKTRVASHEPTIVQIITDQNGGPPRRLDPLGRLARLLRYPP